jgi:hypothetical protein
MTTRRDFIRTMSVASAGIALGSNGILNAATNMPNQKPKGEKVKIAYIGIGNRGMQIIEHFAEMSKPFGVDIKIENGLGVVQL